ncbi:hypothetical protein MKX03_014402 [Papaver bracteatum]|nr:hypothetical protein MKX03_014402 [Papaver bracteatum]
MGNQNQIIGLGAAALVLGIWEFYKLLKKSMGEEKQKKMKIFKVSEIKDAYQVDGDTRKFCIQPIVKWHLLHIQSTYPVLACIESLPKSDGRFLQKGTWNLQRLICISPLVEKKILLRLLQSELVNSVPRGTRSFFLLLKIQGEVDIRGSMLSHITKYLKQTQVMVVAGVLACIFLLVPSAGAVDALKTCGCLLKECRHLNNVACLQTCNNRPDETECQIKCGDFFENRVVDEFNECAVSRSCTAWDTLQSQQRVRTLPRYTLLSKIENNVDDYVFVYYRGRNDAWDGYGGAFLYTRSSVLPCGIDPEIERAAKSVGWDFNAFSKTDNTSGPEPPLIERIDKTVEEGERIIVRG